MAYATVDEVAQFTDASPDAVKEVHLGSISNIIDAWKGSAYPETAETVTERHSGSGKSRLIFLGNTQIDTITSVSEDDEVVDKANYEMMHGSIIRRIDGYYWRWGDINLVVVAETHDYADALRAATCQIWQLFYTRNKLGGLIRTYPSRLREYTDGGGAVTGYDSLELAIMDALKASLPRHEVMR